LRAAQCAARTCRRDRQGMSVAMNEVEHGVTFVRGVVAGAIRGDAAAQAALALALLSIALFMAFFATGRKKRPSPWKRKPDPPRSGASRPFYEVPNGIKAREQDHPRRQSVDRLCSWRLDQIQPHTEAGHWRWLCRHCDEFGFGSDEAPPDQCVRYLKPSPL
jgi:hypothetical protein